MRLWLWFVPLLLPACASERTVLARHLQECGLITEGDRASSALRNVYLPSACYENCFAEASCEALEGALCRTSLELLLRCDQACAFRCSDGSLVGIERRCNGAIDCEGGADEQGCASAMGCGGASSGVRCDGRYDCPDGSDEEGCPSLNCNGRQFSVRERCNGYGACPDGSDERDCPVYRCDDGQTITLGDDPRCDGRTQCSDASDEAGCAQLMLMCRAP